MKKILFAFLLVFSLTFASAQPSALPPPVLDVGQTKSFKMKNGLTVILIENKTLPIVSFYLEIDNRNYLEGDIKGVSNLTAEMLLRGSTNFTKIQLADTLANMGSQYKVTRSSLYISGLSKYARANMTLLAEMLIRPTFPLGEFEYVKKDFLDNSKLNNSTLDFILNRAYRRLVFSDKSPSGELITSQSINKIQLSDCQNYYNNHWRANQATLLVMGHISIDELKKLCNLRLRAWGGKAAPKKAMYKPLDLATVNVDFIHKPGDKSAGIIISNLAEFNYTSEDIYPVIYLNALLGGNLLNSFTSEFSSRKQSQQVNNPFALMPNTTMGYMYLKSKSLPQNVVSNLKNNIALLEKYREKEISEKKLNDVKRHLNGNFALSMEDRSLMGTCAVAAKTGVMPPDFLQTMLSELNKVNPDDIKRVAEKYIQPEKFRIIIHGDARRIAPEIELAGYNITFYDQNAKQIKQPSLASEVEKGTTTLKVIENYIDALGGYDKLNSLETLEQVFEVSKDDGDTLEVQIIQKSPISIVEYIKAGDNIYFKRVYNGLMGYTKIDTVRKDLSLEQVEKKLKTRTLFPILDYKSAGLKAELDSIVPVKGHFTYKLNVDLNDGTMQSHYISNETFLPLRIDIISKKEKVEYNQDGTLKSYTPEEINSSSLYYDYQSVFGIKFPHRIEANQEAGSTIWKLKKIVPEIKVNKKTFR